MLSGSRPGPGAADCVAMVDPAARLACHDRLHGRAEPMPATADPMALVAGGRVARRGGSRCRRRPKARLRWDLDGQRRRRSPARLQSRSTCCRAPGPTASTRRPTSPSPQHGVDTPLVLKSVEAKYQISLNQVRATACLPGGTQPVGGYAVVAGRSTARTRACYRPSYEPGHDAGGAARSRSLPNGSCCTRRVAEPPVQRPRRCRQLEPPTDRRWARRLGGRGCAPERTRAPDDNNRQLVSTTSAASKTAHGATEVVRAVAAAAPLDAQRQPLTGFRRRWTMCSRWRRAAPAAAVQQLRRETGSTTTCTRPRPAREHHDRRLAVMPQRAGPAHRTYHPRHAPARPVPQLPARRRAHHGVAGPDNLMVLGMGISRGAATA